MEEYTYPVTVEGDWSTLNIKTVQNKLQIYFQNKRKSGGGSCVVVQCSEQSASVGFSSEQTRDNVVAKQDHSLIIENQTIHLKVFKASGDCSKEAKSQPTTSKSSDVTTDDQQLVDQSPKKPKKESLDEPCTVVIQNLPARLNREYAVLLVESFCELAEGEYHLEFIPELSSAVMTFNDPEAAEKFITQSKTKKKFQDYGLKVSFLKACKSVKVENLPAQCNEEWAYLYFEKHAGEVKAVTMIPEEQSAIVTFINHKDVKSILGKSLCVYHTTVEVYPYSDALCTTLYGENRPEWKLPESFTQKIHPAMRDFLQKKDLISSITQEMARHYCQINMDKFEVRFQPHPSLLRQKSINKKQIESWMQTCTDAFKTTMSKFALFEHPVDHLLWSEVEKDIRSTVKDKAVLEMEVSRGQLTLAGMTQDINLLKPILEKFLTDAKIQTERDKYKTVESMSISSAMFALLQQVGLQQNATAKHPQLVLNYKKDINQLEIEGLTMEILYIKNWILEKQFQLKHKTLKMDPSLLEFLRSVNLEEMSVDLFLSKNISAVCKLEQDALVLSASSDQALRDAEEKLKTMLISKSLSLEDINVVEKTEWQDLINQLHNMYNTPKKNKCVLIQSSKHSNNVIIVGGFKEPVMEVSHNLETFITHHSKVNQKIRVKSPAVVKFIKEKKTVEWQGFTNKVLINFHPRRPLIEVSGERVHVQPALKFFQTLSKDLHTDRMVIKKAGVKKFFEEQSVMVNMMIRDYKFAVVIEEDVLEEEDQGDDDDDDDDIKDFEVLCEVQTPGGIIIRVMKADMCRMKVDAVVNAANEDLKHIGGLALALLKAAGPSLQDSSDCYVLANGKLNPGEAITTQAGRLPCQYVVHVVGPRYNSNTQSDSIKILRKAVRESLKEASQYTCTSIAMPAISSGVFGFPLQLCTETIAKELCEYTNKQQRAMVKEIYLVDKNPTTVKAMAQAVKKEFNELKPKTTFSPKMESHGDSYEGRAKFGPSHYDLRSQQNNESGESGRRAGGAESRVYKMKSSEAEGQTTLEFLSTKEGVKIILQEGNIQDAQSDVIVNSVSANLDLSHGAVSKALLQAAGPQIQREADTNLTSLGTSLDSGDMLITDGYNLKCQRVFHAVCPQWSGVAGQEAEVLKRIIQNCLQKAEKQKMASITFPALGTGNLRFPKDIVCKILLGEIYAFSSRSTPLFLKDVSVIVHPSDKDCVQRFIQEFRGWQGHDLNGAKGAQVVQHTPVKKGQSTGLFGVVSTPTLGVHRVQVGKLTLEVSSGDITREKCDAIVNSSNQGFTLKAGVSKAILDAAGSSVEQECAQQAVLQQSEMILTSGGQLLCKHIIHIVGRNKPAEIKNIVYSVLKLCEEQKFTSVAFPALGTGQGGANPTDVADSMIDAVAEFVKKKKVVVLQNVKFLIFQTQMVSNFHQSMLKRQQEGEGDQGGVMSWLKDQADKMVNFVWGGGKNESAKEDFVIVSVESEPVVFQLCGESKQDLNDARHLINNFILKEHISSSIQDSAINHFGQDESNVLKNMQRELSVSIHLSKEGPEPEITVEGLSRDVVKAENNIRNMVRKVEKNLMRQREAFTIGSQVQWHYKDQSNNCVPFDLLTNYDLEDAWRMQNSTVKIAINNTEYDAYVAKLVAVRNNIQIKLKRTEQKDQSTLPSHWEDMKGKLVITVQLKSGTTEYTDVEKEFRRTGLTLNILRIDRVQNETLWKNYINQMSYLEKKNKHQNNEKRLFHGTGHQNIEKINNQGFNRSFAGTAVGAMIGNGVYFAVDPAYSAQGYAKPDQLGHKRMYLAKVLVGDSTLGKGGLLAPPAKSSTGTELYDSVTDSRQSMFVIFHDVQAYPEYLITFQ